MRHGRTAGGATDRTSPGRPHRGCARRFGQIRCEETLVKKAPRPAPWQMSHLFWSAGYSHGRVHQRTQCNGDLITRRGIGHRVEGAVGLPAMNHPHRSRPIEGRQGTGAVAPVGSRDGGSGISRGPSGPRSSQPRRLSGGLERSSDKTNRATSTTMLITTTIKSGPNKCPAVFHQARSLPAPP